MSVMTYERQEALETMAFSCAGGDVKFRPVRVAAGGRGIALRGAVGRPTAGRSRFRAKVAASQPAGIATMRRTTGAARRRCQLLRHIWALLVASTAPARKADKDFIVYHIVVEAFGRPGRRTLRKALSFTVAQAATTAFVG